MRFTKVAIVLVAFLWGTSFAFTKGILEVVNPLTFTFYNFLLTGLVFLFYSIYKKKNLLYRIKEGVILGILVTGMELTQMYGLHLSSAANTSFISNLGMLFIPYLGYIFFKHKIRVIDSIALLCAGVGMYFLVGGIDKTSIGDLFLLVSAVFMAFYFLMSQQYEGEDDRHLSVICTQQFLVVSVVTGIMILFGQHSFFVEHTVIIHLILLILIFTTLPYALIQWSSKYSNEMMISIYDGVVEPLVGGIVAWSLFLEKTSTSQVIGGLGMVFAFGLSTIYTQRHTLFKKHKK